MRIVEAEQKRDQEVGDGHKLSKFQSTSAMTGKALEGVSGNDVL